jgi:hypothetical protein
MLRSVAVVGGASRSFEHAELCPKEKARLLAMERIGEEWQCAVALPTGLAYTEEPITTTGSGHEEPASSRGFAFRFGLFRRKPDRNPYADSLLRALLVHSSEVPRVFRNMTLTLPDCRRANLPVAMGVATVPTRSIEAGLPRGSVELIVPLVVSTHRLFARGEDADDEDDAADAVAKPPAAAESLKCKPTSESGANKPKSAKRGWLHGLMSKLQRSGGKGKREKEEQKDVKEEQKDVKEEEKEEEEEEEDEDEDEEEAMGKIVGQLRVLITFDCSSDAA